VVISCKRRRPVTQTMMTILMSQMNKTSGAEWACTEIDIVQSTRIGAIKWNSSNGLDASKVNSVDEGDDGEQVRVSQLK
jgi:hypothetical protein